MAIPNIQHIISDDLIRTKVNSIQPNIRKNTQNVNNPQTTNIASSAAETTDNTDKHIVQDSIDKMNKTIQIFNKRIKLSIHEESKRVVIKIIDTQTDKVIKEIPPKEVLNFISKLHESIGVLIDRKQ